MNPRRREVGGNAEGSVGVGPRVGRRHIPSRCVRIRGHAGWAAPTANGIGGAAAASRFCSAVRLSASSM